MAAGDERTTLDLMELLATARTLTEELTARVADPGLLDVIARFPAEPEVDRSRQWGLSAVAGSGIDSGVTVSGDAPEAVADAEATAANAPEGYAIEPTDADGTLAGTRGVGRAASDGSLPAIQLQVENLARQLEAVRTALAGHVDRAFDQPVQRKEVLGIPEGKSAYRNSAEYLCHHLQIRRSEARRRLGRAGLVMSHRSLGQTHVLPPRMPVLAGVVHHGQADIASVDVIAETLDAARKDATLAGADPRVVDEMISDGESVLGAQAKDSDPDTVKKACVYWRQRFDALANPDGIEPTEAQAQAVQGLFYHGRGPANLHRWSLLAGDAQHEILKTIASAASSHRRRPASPPGASKTAPRASNAEGSHGDVGPEASHGDGDTDSGFIPPGIWSQAAEASDALDSRSRGQRELDGLISALIGALSLTTHGDGGVRPQVLVTIDYQTLAGQLQEAGSTGTLISQAAYTGPVTPQTIRRVACDADLIPVVLGGEGEVLDVDRAHRLFPRRLRRAITARDGGCAAPACSIPAPWCEAHHIEHWENGGPTSVDNGVLLCSHHHHAVHSGNWEISVREGIPWFIPARHHDLERRPRRNRYWRPGALDEAA